MLSGLAAHERDMIRERSISGTERLAHGEPWLGGVVPYGYRIEGERSTAQCSFRKKGSMDSRCEGPHLVRGLALPYGKKQTKVIPLPGNTPF